MSNDRRPVPTEPNDTNAILAWVQEAARQVRLAWRLFWDQRVPVWTKLIPPIALGYVLVPIDLVPDVALGLGQLDDLAVVLLGLKLFIELSPPDVVREHLRALGARIDEWRVVDEEEKENTPPTIIEGEYRLEPPETEDSDTKAS
jgi:uncharacterized membrane protein YkvA (DUF1232 family)